MRNVSYRWWDYAQCELQVVGLCAMWTTGGGTMRNMSYRWWDYEQCELQVVGLCAM
jgi:hypothetical protein